MACFIVAGTGVAPMRALMHERIALAASPSESTSQSATVSEIGKKTSVTLLLFGCRSQQDDYLYESEWHQCLEDVGVNGTVVTNCNSEDKAEILPPFDFSSNFSEQKGIQLYSPDLSLPPSTSLPSRSSSHPTAVVVTAFSRQGRHAGRRVTHSLHTHREAVWSLIRQVRRRDIMLQLIFLLTFIFGIGPLICFVASTHLLSSFCVLYVSLSY